jgi:pRiA4b ORF-3-like protein
VILNQILSRPKQKMIYEYDFGDGWEHELLLERVLAPEPGVRYPRCTDGARACPPEDCGGTGGYENFLAAIRDPNHEEHEEYLEWIGDEFDPEQFDVADVNAALRRVR